MNNDNITHAAANKAAEEGEQDVQSLYKAYFRSDDSVPGFSAARPVANKAEVEPDTQAQAIFPPEFPAFNAHGLEGSMPPDELWDYACLVGYRCATSPATTGASTVLTDERIERVYQKGYDDFAGPRQFRHAVNRNVYHRAGLRELAREVAAQAGKVAVPEDRVKLAELAIAAGYSMAAAEVANEHSIGKGGPGCAERVLRTEKLFASAVNELAAPSPAKEWK